MTETLHTVVVGTGFKGREAVGAVQKMAPGDSVRIVRDRDNRYDANAVACHFLGLHVGFVPKIVNARLAAALDRGATAAAVVTAPAKAELGRSGPRIKIEPKITISWEPR